MGYKSRAAFKLLEIDKKYKLLKNASITDRDFSDKCIYYFQCEKPIDELIKEATSSTAKLEFINKDAIEVEVNPN